MHASIFLCDYIEDARRAVVEVAWLPCSYDVAHPDCVLQGGQLRWSPGSHGCKYCKAWPQRAKLDEAEPRLSLGWAGPAAQATLGECFRLAALGLGLGHSWARATLSLGC